MPIIVWSSYLGNISN